MFARLALRLIPKTALLAGAALLVWSAVAGPSVAHGRKVEYRVKPYDTLWTIASARYGGDPREGVWQIERVNHLAGATIQVGELLVLP